MRGRPKTKHVNTVKASLLGYQTWRYGRFALYRLLEPIPGHPVGDIVSTNTLKLAGYVPDAVTS